MFTPLAITFDKKITLMQCLWYQKLDFKIFPMIYYMPNSDNRAKNNKRLKFALIFSTCVNGPSRTKHAIGPRQSRTNTRLNCDRIAKIRD